MIADSDMPQGYRSVMATATELLIVDEGQPGLQLQADLDEHGIVVFHVRTEADGTAARGIVRGSVLFELMMRHFSVGVRTIRSCWTSGSNYELFRQLLSEGATIHEAASNTWTGKQAQRQGFLAVVIRRLNFVPQPDSVMVDFLRGRIFGMIHDHLNEDLRAEFRRGATFAGLIHRARELSPAETNRDDWANAVRKAFRLKLHGWGLLDLTDSFGNGRHRDEILTSFHLGMLLQNRPLWDRPPSVREGAWYDSVAWEPMDPPCVFRETTASMLAALAEALQRRASVSKASPSAEHRMTAAAA